MTELKLSMQKNEREAVPLANVFTPLPMRSPQQGEPHKYYTWCGFVLQAALKQNRKETDKMGKILEAFANNELLVVELSDKRSPQRKKLMEEGEKLHAALKEKLNDEQKEMLEQLIETIYQENCHYIQERLIRGYRLGVLMTMEVFSERDTYF